MAHVPMPMVFNVRCIKGIDGGNMKNLMIAALAAAQMMDWWCKYCRSGEDVVYCTLTLFYFFLLLIHWMDKQIEKRKRIRDTRRRIEEVMERHKELQRRLDKCAEQGE